MDFGDIEMFRMPAAQAVEVRKTDTTRATTLRRTNPRLAEPFLCGPIPLAWLQRAATLSRSNAIKVGLVLHYLAGLAKKSEGLVLTVERCKPRGLLRKSAQSGLRDLERASLVRVQRVNGRAARVDILGIPTYEDSVDGSSSNEREVSDG